HGAGHATRNTTVVQRQVLGTVERTDVESVSTPPLHERRARPLPRFVGLRRDFAVLWIGDEPGAAVLRVVILEPVGRAGTGLGTTEGRCDLDLPIVPLLNRLRQFGWRHILDALAFELGRALEGSAALVGVVIGALQVRVAPRRPRCRPRG